MTRCKTPLLIAVAFAVGLLLGALLVGWVGDSDSPEPADVSALTLYGSTAQKLVQLQAAVTALEKDVAKLKTQVAGLSTSTTTVRPTTTTKPPTTTATTKPPSTTTTKPTTTTAKPTTTLPPTTSTTTTLATTTTTVAPTTTTKPPTTTTTKSTTTTAPSTTTTVKPTTTTTKPTTTTSTSTTTTSTTSTTLPPTTSTTAKTTRTTGLTVRSGQTVEHIHWQGPGPAGSLIGLSGDGINGATLRHLSMDGCMYGAKFSGGKGNRGLIAEDWQITDSDQGLYLSYTEDSVLEGLTMDISPTSPHGSASNHAIYIERGCHNLTLRDIILRGGAGYLLHIYNETSITADRTTDILCEAATLGAPESPVYPVAIYRSDHITLRGVRGWARAGEPAIKLRDCTDVLLEDVHMVGGAKFLDQSGCTNVRAIGCTWNGKPVIL